MAIPINGTIPIITIRQALVKMAIPLLPEIFTMIMFRKNIARAIESWAKEAGMPTRSISLIIFPLNLKPEKRMVT